MKKNLVAAALAAAFLLPAGSARPCGGPEFDLIDQALKPIDEFIAWSAVQECNPEEADSTCAYVFNLATILELRFLYPFHLAKPDAYRELWNRSYFEYEVSAGELPKAAPLGWETLDQKVVSQDWEGAEKEARSLVDRILNMPLAQANENQPALARAVAAIELKPLSGSVPHESLREFWSELWKTSYLPAFVKKAPRAAGPLTEARQGTFRLLDLKEAMRTEIPDGWIEEIRNKMTPEAWRALEARHEAWLKDFPNHPLSDVVRLSQVRLAYLKGNAGEAWRVLFSLYPRRPVRAVGEMRFLLQQGLAPDPASLPDDPVLLSALTPWIKFRSAETWNPLWTRLWNLTNAKAPWAANLQERLLKKVADEASPGAPLPEGFPEIPLNPSPRWASFRLFALYKAGRWDQALAQAGTIKHNADTAAVVAKLHLRRKEWREALAVKELPFDAKRYLIRVLFDDEALRSLQDLSDPKLRGEVLLTLAVRAAARGDWRTGAALLAEGDLRRSGLWEQAARLAADKTPSGDLALGRFLKKNDGKLFYPPDTVWYRSVFWRLSAVGRRVGPDAPPPEVDPGLPWSAEAESEAIRTHLKSLEPFLSLKAYAGYLKATSGRGKERAAALKEGDRAYNWLLNWANNYSKDWQDLLDGSEEAKIIRQAGKEM